VLTDLLDQVLFEPLYDALRTKQQLGYTVSSGARLTHGVVGFAVTVVSAAFDAQVVEQRVGDFLQEFYDGALAVRVDILLRSLMLECVVFVFVCVCVCVCVSM
jgi:secreted Zn-dependent insulinase-like peptidase